MELLKKKKLLYFLFFVNIIYSQTINAQTKTDLPCIGKKFSIVAHLVQDSLKKTGVSETDIRSDIDSLNRALKDICISFEICEFETIENFTYNKFNEDTVWEEMRTIYNNKNRINMYFVSEIISPSNENGLATQNGINILDTSGIVVLKAPHMFSNISHQIGHFFGLLNTFGTTANEFVDGSNCSTAGDFLCDTPADPYLIAESTVGYVNGCRFISKKKDAKTMFYDPHVGNIMSNYSTCGCEYSRQQLKIMADTYNAGKGMW